MPDPGPSSRTADGVGTGPPEPSPRSVQDHPPSQHLLHPPPSPLPKLWPGLRQRGCPRRGSQARGRWPRHCRLPCAWGLLSNAAKPPDGAKRTRGFPGRRGNAWDEDPSRHDARVTSPGPSVLPRTGLKLAPKPTA